MTCSGAEPAADAPAGAGPPAPHRGRPLLLVVTGPSGAGKGTLIRGLLDRVADLAVSVSATTRPRRPGEEDGREYWFLSEDEFGRRVAAGEFLEHVAYVGGRYGTLWSEVERIHGLGKSCVLELETIGARAVEAGRPATLSVFIAAPSLDELERRLRERDTESAGEIGERLALARAQMDEAGDFDYVVVNDDVERAVDELVRIVERALERAGEGAPPATLDRCMD